MIGRTVWGPTVPKWKRTEVSLSYVQCFLYLLSSINVFIFHITWRDTFWTDLIGTETGSGPCQTPLPGTPIPSHVITLPFSHHNCCLCKWAFSPNNRSWHGESRTGTRSRWILTVARWYLIAAIIHKSTHSRCQRGCGEKETYVHCWWERRLVQPLWKTVWKVLTKLKNGTDVWPTNSTSGYTSITEETQNTNSKEYTHPYVHCGITYNRQDMEATKVPINREVDKKQWCMCTMEYYSTLKKPKSCHLWQHWWTQSLLC